jgi:two-component system response regulator PilR (NtrC family)
MNAMKRLKILVVEDDSLNRDLICTLLRGYGDIQEATTLEEALDLLSFNQFDLAFVDLDLHGKPSGFKIARLAKDKSIYTVILSGQKDSTSIKKAFDYSDCDNYLYKPANLSMVKDVMAHFANQNEVLKLDQLISSTFTTKSSKLSELLGVVKTVYKGQTPIYIFGETGTGKQVLAELIHKLKYESLESFYHLNCAAISDSIIESELFGHMKGAFTGADTRKIGLFEKANGGTLFLDEIATMSPLMQNKIITAIETKKFKPVGSIKEVESHFRLIAATSSNLTEEVQAGKFRQDLFFRINGVHLKMPSLKERKEDLEILIETISQSHSSQRALYVTKEVTKYLQDYDWPGNIRELKNLIFSWLDRSISKPEAKDVPPHIINNENIFLRTKHRFLTKKQIQQIEEMGLKEFLKELEMEAIEVAYKKNRKKVRATAKTLQVHTDKVYWYLDNSIGEQHELFQ